LLRRFPPSFLFFGFLAFVLFAGGEGATHASPLREYFDQLCDAFSNLKISQGRYTTGTTRADLRVDG